MASIEELYSFGGIARKMVQLGQRNIDADAVLETPIGVSQRRYPMTIPQSTPAQETPQEEWREVVGYEGLYEVSNVGRVRRVISYHGLPAGRVLRDCATGRARKYRFVGLYRNMQQRAHYVHRLVAAAFIGPIPPGYEVNHRDGNPANNHLSNLEIVTPQRNKEHAVETGLHDIKGTKNPSSRLTEDNVRAIREAEGTCAALATRFGVSRSLIWLVRRRKVWGQVA